MAKPHSMIKTAYALIAGELRRGILTGQFEPGGQLPTERALCERFAASRITIRRSLAILEEERLLVREQGRGTFVSRTPSRQIPLLDADFLGSLAAHAPDMERRLAEWSWVPAAPDQAVRLGIMTGQRLCFARRYDVLDGQVIAYDDVYIPEQFADRLTEPDLGRLDFLERWQAVQSITAAYVRQMIDAVPADRDIRRHLPVPRGVPVLRGDETFFQANDQAIGVFTSYYRHDRFRLQGVVRLHTTSPPPASPPAPSGPPRPADFQEGGPGQGTRASARRSTSANP